MWSSIRLRPFSLQGIPTRRALSALRNRNAHRGPRGSIIRSSRIQPDQNTPNPPSRTEETESTPQDAPNPNYDPSQNTLLSPVHLPEDPNAVLKENHPATNILANSGLVVQRQLEMMTVMV